MRGKRYTEEQIIGVLKKAEAGMPVPELLRKHGVSRRTFYRWKAKYGGSREHGTGQNGQRVGGDGWVVPTKEQVAERLAY